MKGTSSKHRFEVAQDIERAVPRLARDEKGALRIRSMSLRLSPVARDGLRKALIGCSVEFKTNEELVRKCGELLGILRDTAPTVARYCSQIGRRSGPEAVFIDGLPAPERACDAKLVALTLAAATGSPFQYASQNDGQVCALLRPAAGAPSNSNASALEFEPHVDDPNVPLAMRVQAITLAGFINTGRTETGYGSLAELLEALPAEVIAALLRYEYRFSAPSSFNHGAGHWTAPRPVLFRSTAGEMVIQYQSFGIRPTTRVAREALAVLRVAIDQAMSWYVVEPGSALVFSNTGGVHARRPIVGLREVVRVYTRRSLRALQESDGTEGPVFDVSSVI